MYSFIPTLETERLILREPRLSDISEVAMLRQDPRVYETTLRKPLTQDEVIARMFSQIGHWAVREYGVWQIVEKSSGKVIGETGFFESIRDTQPPVRGRIEVNWVMSPDVQGKGYAFEAVTESHSWGKKFLSQNTTICLVDINNNASLKLAQKMGYQQISKTVCNDAPAYLFERTF